MSDKPPTTTVGMVASFGEKLVGVLPPAFLLLVIINILFLGVASWVFMHNTDARTAMIEKIVDACLLERKARQ